MNVIKELYKSNLKLKTLQAIIYRQGGNDKEIEKVVDSIGISITRLIRLTALPMKEETELQRELKRIDLTQEEIEELKFFNIDEVEQAYDGKFFGVSDSTNNGNWAKIGKNQIEQCITHLRTLYKLKNDGIDLINPKGIETAEKFSWKNCASIINNNI